MKKITLFFLCFICNPFLLFAEFQWLDLKNHDKTTNWTSNYGYTVTISGAWTSTISGSSGSNYVLRSGTAVPTLADSLGFSLDDYTSYSTSFNFGTGDSAIGVDSIVGVANLSANAAVSTARIQFYDQDGNLIPNGNASVVAYYRQSIYPSQQNPTCVNSESYF